MADCIVAVADAAGLRSGPLPVPPPPAVFAAGGPATFRWLDRLGVRADAGLVSVSELRPGLSVCPPAVVRSPSGELVGLVRRGRRGAVETIAPDGRRRWVGAEAVADRLLAPVRGRAVDPILAGSGLDPRAQRRAAPALLELTFGGRDACSFTMLDIPADRPLGLLARRAGLIRSAAGFVGASLASQLVGMAGWLILGRAGLTGRLEASELILWALVLMASTALRLFASGTQARLQVGLGLLLRSRYLEGALRLDADALRAEGIGALLSRVYRTSTLTSTLGVLSSVMAVVIDLMVAPFVIASGPAASVLMPLYSVAMALVVALGLRFARGRVSALSRMDRLTEALVERLIGHRTRLVQEPLEDWPLGLDEPTAQAYEAMRRLDRLGAALRTGLVRGWMVVGPLALLPAVLAGAGATELVVGLGGVLLVWRALRTLAQALSSATGVWADLTAVWPLLRAAERPRLWGTVDADVAPSRHDRAIMELRGAGFAYAGRPAPSLSGVDLEVRAGDRLVLEGPSGAGKSTLASLLVGSRSPTTGLALLGGLDRASLGEDMWRQVVAAAPQFHENHVLSETLAFNLLMGRSWPAQGRDLEEARALCVELGLGPLLQRMPSGLQQMVGEKGWQLSHGEQSRVFIARALLSHAEVVVLDESFAALDPETLGTVVEVVHRRAKTLIVIAHP